MEDFPPLNERIDATFVSVYFLPYKADYNAQNFRWITDEVEIQQKGF